MNINLSDRRVTTALAAIFLLGLACALLLVLAVLVLCAMLVNALIGTISEAVTTVGALYTHGGPLTHLVFLLLVLFGIPFGIKRLRMPVLYFCQRQFARFTAFAQQTSPAPDATREDEQEEAPDYMEGEVTELDDKEEAYQARTTPTPPPASSRRTPPGSKSRKQHKKQKRGRQTAAPTRAALALTHA